MSAREALGLANQAREEGKFVESLQMLEQAIHGFISTMDYGGAAESLCSQFLTYCHLSDVDNVYLVLAASAVNNALEISKLSKNPADQVLPYFNLGKLNQMQNKYDQAQDVYQKAIELFQSNPPIEHNRLAVLIDFQIHYQVSRLLSGQMNAVGEIEQLISQLETLNESKFNKDVWISGAHMRLAESLMPTDPNLAKDHLNKAKVIIDGNGELSLRSVQWQKLNEKINPIT